MIASPRLRSVRPIVEMSIPSIRIEPDVSSTSRYNAVMIELFPAPVLSEQSVTKGAFEPERIHSPSDDTDLFSWIHRHGQAFQDLREFRTVSKYDLLHLDLSFGGPLARRFPLRNQMRLLLLQRICVMHDTLYAVHIVLDFRHLHNQPIKRLFHGHNVRQCDTSLRRRDTEACANAQDSHDKCQDDTEKVETYAEPSLVDNSQPICTVLNVYELLVFCEEPL